MPSTHSNTKTPRIISVGIPAVAASAIIAAMGIRAFPQISSLLSLPNTETAIENTTVLSPGNSANFVVQAVERVGASVVLIKTERTVANPFPDYFLNILILEICLAKIFYYDCQGNIIGKVKVRDLSSKIGALL